MGRLTSYDENMGLLVNEEERLLSSKGFIDKDEMYKVMRHLAEKLAEYENLEEQGKLLKLPCKVGEPIYYIQGNCEGIPKEMMFVDRTFFNLNMISKVGTEFFLTQEQAENALKEMKEREGEDGN